MPAYITSVWRYPVKSMIGEEQSESVISERGLQGDRAYALVDSATGKIASAKNPKKWAKLFDCQATGATPANIRFPDGSTASTEEPGIDELLSNLFGREVHLRSAAPENPSLEEYWPDIDGLPFRETITDESTGNGAPPGTFFDYGPVHLLTTATVRQLHAFYPSGRFDIARFRPNLVVDSAGEGFVENDWVGHTIQIGADVRLHVTNPCARCVMTTMAQGDLPNDHGILRTTAQHNRVHVPAAGMTLPSVGVYATVVRGGVVRRGDEVTVFP